MVALGRLPQAGMPEAGIQTLWRGNLAAMSERGEAAKNRTAYRHIFDIGDSIGTLMRFGSASSAAILLS